MSARHSMRLQTICVAIALSCFFASQSVAETYEWPQWLGPNRDGITQETGLLQEWPEAGPKLLWMNNDAGIGYSGPAIAGGRMFLMGSRDSIEQLIALDPNTGKELWHADISSPEFENDWGNGPRGTPTVDGDRVYALSASGTLICASASSGEVIWTVTMKEFGGEVPYWGYSESPLVDDGLVLVTPGGKEGAIAALDKRTGEVKWRSEGLDDGAHYSSMITATIHGRKQYIQLLPKRLVGVSPDNGELLWETGWPGRTAVIPTPIVRGSQVYITSGYGMGSKLVTISPENDVEVVYENKVMKNHHGGVVLVGDQLYGHSDGPGWTCQDFATGKSIWKERRALGKGAIAYADGRLYCLGESDGDVVLIGATPDDWQEHGRFTLTPQTERRKEKGRIWTHPVIVNGKLYLRDQDLVYCFDIRAAGK